MGNRINWLVAGVAVSLALAACVSSPVITSVSATGPTQTSLDSTGPSGPIVIATVAPPESTLAGASEDPWDLIKGNDAGSGYLTVEGTVNNVEYDMLISREGVDEAFEVRFPITYFEVRLRRADSRATGSIRVQVGGAYLPVTADDNAAGITAPITRAGEAVEFSMPGGGPPVREGERVLLFLRPTTSSTLADYVVVGQAYGYFREDPTTHRYTQSAATIRDVVMSDEQLDAAFG